MAKVLLLFRPKLPSAKSNHRKFLQLFPSAMSQFDLSAYDLVLALPRQLPKECEPNRASAYLLLSFAYALCLDLQAQYLQDAGLNKGLKGKYAQYVA
jgi:hypothetical protein